MKRLPAYLFFYGLPAIWGYLGGSYWVPLIGAVYLAGEMVWAGWRYDHRGQTAPMPSLIMAAVFTAIPCLGAYFLGRWIAGY